MPLDGNITDFAPAEQQTAEPSVRDVLLRAAAEVRKGWMQGNCGAFMALEGPVCAGGAIMRVIGSANFSGSSAYEALEKYVRANTDAYGVPHFNDVIAQSAEEVAAVMEAAALSTE